LAGAAVARQARGGAVSAQDYRVNAEARRLLVSRWVDVAALQIGTTNGVIYVLGRLDTTVEDPHKRDDARQRSVERLLILVSALEKDLRRIRDVRDVVLKFDNLCKRGGRWRAADGSAAIAPAHHVQRHVLRAPRSNDAIELDHDADEEALP
jgi:hypothetical protein